MNDRTSMERSVNNVMTLTRKRQVNNVISPLKRSYIYLLGRMRILGADGEDILPAAKKTKAVLAYLCLARGEMVSRSRLAGILWDQSSESLARDHLRHTLAQVNQIAGNWQLERTRHWVRLDAKDCWIDVFEMPDRPDLLDDLNDVSPTFDQWLLEERSRYENECQLRLQRRLDDLVTQAADPDARVDAARQLLRFQPAHQQALRYLMTALVDGGDPAQALHECERFETLLAASHDMRAADKTIALREKIRQEWQIAPVPKATQQKAIQDIQVAGQGAEKMMEAAKQQPSIAVLPFRDLSIKSGNSHVADGLTDDLVEALSRMPSLFVISRLSSAVFRKQDRSPPEIGAALGVRYLLSGSVRIIGERLRLNAELTDVTTGILLWSDRFDREFSDLLDMQDQLAEAVVRAIAPYVRSAELKRLMIVRQEDRGAYHLLLTAQEAMNTLSRNAFEDAERLFDRAIEQRPDYATALACRAHWHVLRVGQGWSPDPDSDTKRAQHFARRAIECDPTEPLALAVQGHVAAYLLKDFGLAFELFDRALEINPNASRTWLWNAAAHGFRGEGTSAVEKIERAMALSPFDPLKYAYSGIASMAYLANRQFGRAIEFAERCKRENPAYTTAYKALIFTLVLAGRIEEARIPARQLLQLEPDYSLDQYRRRSPISAGPVGELYGDALVKAGIPLV